jgi:chromosome partitioning protein
VFTIAVAANKGGSGKTTTAAGLAGGLAAAGHRVLAVDGDPQGALSAALGVPDKVPTVYRVLAGELAAQDAVRAVEGVPGLDVLPADLDLATVEIELARVDGWPAALVQPLEQLAAGYDVAIIDTAPGLGMLPMMGLIAADAALIVCPPQFLSLRTLEAVGKTLSYARELVGESPPILGVVPTLVGRHTGAQSEILTLLATRFTDAVLPEIPMRVAIERASAAGLPVTHWEPSSDAAEAFRALAREVWSRAQAQAR